MQRVEQEITRLINEINYDEVNRLFEIISRGKKLRAKLVLKIAPDHKKAPLLAAIIELIHMASLLHDDVIDDASKRRGVKSVNASEGSKVAIMLGDILYSKAFSELASFDEKIAKTISKSIVSLSKGEMQDVNMSQYFNSNEDKYLDMLYLKTASLIEATTVSSAILADKDEQKYAIFGRNLGLSFQLIDDILDITSSEKILGKPVMNDFAEGKCTLPYIYLWKSLNADNQETLVSMHKKTLNIDEILWIKNMMKEHKSIEKSFSFAKNLSLEAKEAVIDNEDLLYILETMIERKY